MLFAFQDGPAVGSKFHVQTQRSGSGAKRRSRASWESLRGTRKPSRTLPRRHGKRPRCLTTGPKRHRTKLSEFFWGNAAHEDEVVMHVCSWQTFPARGSDSLAVAVSPYSWQYIPAHASVFLHVAILATMLLALQAMVPMHVWPWTRATAGSAKIILVGTVADHRASGLG